MPDKEIPKKLVEYMLANMAPQATMFFIGVLETFGTLNAVLPGVIPHPVHFRDGMQVRNMMRESNLCKDWDAHDFDDNWGRVIIQVIEQFKKKHADVIAST